jgi:hypothetical protein
MSGGNNYMLKSSGKDTPDDEGPPFRMLPLVQLQALVMDLATAVEEMRYEVENLKEELAKLEAAHASTE